MSSRITRRDERQPQTRARFRAFLAITLAALLGVVVFANTELNAAGADTDYLLTAQSSNPFNSNSCQWANDGVCDEPTNCDIGTDSADCRDALGRPIPNSCNFRNDGACDEPANCIIGTDTRDCYDKTGQPIPDSCNFARDGECDEPVNCIFGTDTSDCR